MRQSCQNHTDCCDSDIDRLCTLTTAYYRNCKLVELAELNAMVGIYTKYTYHKSNGLCRLPDDPYIDSRQYCPTMPRSFCLLDSSLSSFRKRTAE